jgi:predicted AAA+ superfamily ATPase
LEYLVFKKQTYDPKMLLVTSKKIKLKQHFNLFLKQGGMPEYVLYEQAEVLTRNYEDILYRDIITRYKIKDIMAFRRLSLYLFNNFSTRITYNSLGPLVKIANTSTISNYIHYLENSYLIFTVKQFSYSVKQQLLLPKKIYVIDNGMAEVVSINFSENKGRYLENTVFLELKRRYKEIYYYQTQGNKEVDFVIFEKGKAKYLIQVCYHLNANAGKTKEREVAALVEAMKELKIHEALILTEDEREDIINDKNTIFVRPVYEWLLESIRFLV